MEGRNETMDRNRRENVKKISKWERDNYYTQYCRAREYFEAKRSQNTSNHCWKEERERKMEMGTGGEK